MPAKNIRISGGKQIVVPNIISSTPSEESVIVSVNTSTYSGKGSISSYRITTNPSNIVVDSGSPNVTVTGLVPGTSYTFSIRLTNSTGIISETSAFGSSATPFRFKAAYYPGGIYEQSGQPVVNYSSIIKITQLGVSSTLSATLASQLRAAAGFANSPWNAYIVGGEPPAVNTYQKININTETRSTISATLPTATFAFYGASNNNVAGYNFGGYTTTSTNRIDKLLFSNETRSTLSSVLSGVTTNSAAFARGSISSYIIGGLVFPSSPFNRINLLNFSNDTITNLGAILRSNMFATVSISNGTNFGYVIGGSTTTLSTGVIATCDKFDLSTNTRSALSSSLSQGKTWGSGASFNGSHGYYSGGHRGPNMFIDSEKLTYSNDTFSSVGNMPYATRQTACSTNSGIF